MAARRALVCAVVVLSLAPLGAWKNPRPSETLNTPIFGTHDWIAFKAYELAGRPSFLKNSLTRYFIGTEAPDNGFKPGDAEGTYHDTSPCHCILFDNDAAVTQDRNELRTRQEFDKAVAALAAGKPRLAAFYVGALAHYIGDLAQFCHIMGKLSHWGPENATLHGNYEVALRPPSDSRHGHPRCSRASSRRSRLQVILQKRSLGQWRCASSAAPAPVTELLASCTSTTRG